MELLTDFLFHWPFFMLLELMLNQLLFVKDLKGKFGIFLDGIVLLLAFPLFVITGGLDILDFCLSIILSLPKMVNEFGQFIHLF